MLNKSSKRTLKVISKHSGIYETAKEIVNDPKIDKRDISELIRDGYIRSPESKLVDGFTSTMNHGLSLTPKGKKALEDWNNSVVLIWLPPILSIISTGIALAALIISLLK